MTSFAAASWRWLGRLFQGQSSYAAPTTQTTMVLDGQSAVALSESQYVDTAALGATFPAAAGARFWSSIASQRRRQSDAVPLGSIEALDPRGALATTIGLALSGQRASSYLSGPDLAGAADLLAQAAGQHLSLVIHLACRALPGQGQTLGSGHQTYHAISDCGCLQLFALNVQEAVDLAMIARRACERALVPGVIAMDGEQTALAAQEVCLCDAESIKAYVGQSSQRIEPPTEAQRMIFGSSRRMVPRFYDLEQPLLLGPLQDQQSFAVGRAGSGTHFLKHLDGLLSDAFDEFARQTGRQYGPLFEHRLDGAEIVLLAQGSAVETATAVANWARDDNRKSVGVLGLRCLRPFPAAQIAARLKGAKTVAVLERADAPLAGDGPLSREIRAALDQRDKPRLVNVPYGLGGLPLRGADLVELLRELDEPKHTVVYLGLDFVGRDSAYPKRQALLDSLRRHDDDLSPRGLCSDKAPPELRPDGATTIAIHRVAGQGDEALAGDAATMIHQALGGQIRSRPAMTWHRCDEPVADFITHAPAELRDAGDDVAVDIAVIASTKIHRLMDPTTRLARGGTVLWFTDCNAEKFLAQLPQRVGRSLQAKDAELYIVEIPEHDAALNNSGQSNCELLLGGLLAVLLLRQGTSVWSSGKIRSVGQAVIANTDEADAANPQWLDRFVAAFDSIKRVHWQGDLPGGEQPACSPTTPLAVRRLSRIDNTLDCLARFWDQTGVLYRDGKSAELVADPYMAVGAVPPLTATFRDVSDSRDCLLVFDPQTADGHGRSWTSCPDGSVVPVAISARALIDTGIKLVAAQGGSADAIRSIAGKLANRVNKLIKEDDAPPTAGELLAEAFKLVMEKADAPQEQEALLAQACDAVIAQVGKLPVARTAAFFDDAEHAARGSGELFSLVVNPDACKSPQLILTHCNGRGLKAIAQTPQALDDARQLWQLCQQLPDTSGQTIERLSKHNDVGSAAAMMLSRHCLMAMTGGDGAEAGSGAKHALRYVLATAEYHLQPRLAEYLKQIESVQEQLAQRIRQTLSESLPTGDLDALAQGIDLLGRNDVDLASLSAKVDAAVQAAQVDGAALGRLVDVARGLADLHWHLSQGPDGLGRARVGLTIGSGSVARWIGAFPYNPLQNPAVIDPSGQGGHLGRGLIEGQLRQAIAGFRLMRWAGLELEQPTDIAAEVKQLESLSFADLTEDERGLCPPLLLIGDDQAFSGSELGQLAWLLNSGLPVKIVVLGDSGGGADNALNVDALSSFPPGQRCDLALLGLLNRNAYVAQVSFAQPDHLVESVLGALRFAGPALISIHAPSPEAHGFAATDLFKQAELAVASRGFPLLRFDPVAEGVFGSRLDLSHNPSSEAPWHSDEHGQVLTAAHWAATEQRFAGHLRPLTQEDSPALPLEKYLELPASQRQDKTPFITTGSGDQQQRLAVGAALIADSQQRQQLWRTLQELAGVVTPFTKQVHAQAVRDVAQQHEAEINALKQQYEAQLAQLKAQYEAEATQRVTGRLMHLAGYGIAATGNGGAKRS